MLFVRVAYRFCVALALVLTTGLVFANKGESSRILVHTLNYMGQDYKHAVQNGQVVSKDEYAEQLEFCESAQKYFLEFSPSWGAADSAEAGQLVYGLVDMIKNKANPDSVSKKAIEARTKILAITGLKTYPTQYPDIAEAKKLFNVECAKCHGDEGYGNGPEGKDLNPLPRNFHDNIRMAEISPAHIFNTVRLGIEGTGMRSHPDLSDEDVWALAFYVLTLRHPAAENKSYAEKFEAIPLEKIAVESDAQLAADYNLNEDELAVLRNSKPKQSNDHFLVVANSYLSRALVSYTDANGKTALQYASLAYLEGIEPVEMQLKATDPELSEQLEKQFMHLRKMISENQSVEDVSDSIAAAQLTIAQASKVLEKKEYSFWLSLLMSLSILLREGLEAFLVILVILSVLKAGNITNAARWVHAGWIAAVLIGIVLWMLSGKVIAQASSHMAMVEGVVSLIAVFMLLYIGFWLHGKSEIGKWKAYVNKLVKGAVSEGSLFGLASLAFFVVFREVFESVLFLSALNIESGGNQSNAIVLGVLLAFAIVMVFAFVVLKFSTKLPIPKLFKISAIVMGILAIILAGKGVHSLQEIGYMPIHGFHFTRIEQLGIFPTVETVVAQVVILIVVLVINNLRTVSPSKPAMAA